METHERRLKAAQKGGLRSGEASGPGDEVPPGTPGTAEAAYPRCGGTGYLESGEEDFSCNGTGVIFKAVGGGG